MIGQTNSRPTACCAIGARVTFLCSGDAAKALDKLDGRFVGQYSPAFLAYTCIHTYSHTRIHVYTYIQPHSHTRVYIHTATLASSSMHIRVHLNTLYSTPICTYVCFLSLYNVMLCTRRHEMARGRSDSSRFLIFRPQVAKKRRKKQQTILLLLLLLLILLLLLLLIP